MEQNFRLHILLGFGQLSRATDPKDFFFLNERRNERLAYLTK